jgi:hypothetical protein
VLDQLADHELGEMPGVQVRVVAKTGADFIPTELDFAHFSVGLSVNPEERV